MLRVKTPVVELIVMPADVGDEETEKFKVPVPPAAEYVEDNAWPAVAESVDAPVVVTTPLTTNVNVAVEVKRWASVTLTV